jgi:glycosyltransferase involved in cell wall biosynthesis
MHVLSATNNLYPDPEATGSGRYNYEVGRELVERGHDVSVVTRLRGDAHARETVDGMDVYRYDASIPRLPATLREIDRTVASIESNAPVDVVSFHGALSSFGVDRAISNRIPRTYTIHGLWAVEYRDRLVAPSRWAAPWHRLNRALRHRIEARVLDHSDAAIVLSEFMRERLRDHHPGAPSCSVVPGGVDVERFAPIDGPGPETFAEDETSFLTVRRLTPRMGLETLLDAFASVVADGDDAHLYVGGDGPLRDELYERAARLGIDSAVTFLGYVPEEQLASLYAGADVFVLPTLELEGFGLATLEALAAGTPVIGTRAGATPEILGNLERRSAITEPLLVDAGDADALAARLASWARVGEAERTSAGGACRSYVIDEGYTWEHVTDSLERRFEGLLD